MDIVKADKMKKEMRVALWWLKHKFKKEYGVTINEILDDLDNCGNIVIGKIWKELKKAADEIKEEYQQDIALEFPAFILWAVYRDTAYVNPFFYILVNLLRQTNEILPVAEKYYKDPKDWYVNRWNNVKANTSEQKRKGEIPDIEGIMSYDETIFVPQYQQEKNTKYAEQKEKIDRFNEEIDKVRKKSVKQENVR